MPGGRRDHDTTSRPQAEAADTAFPGRFATRNPNVTAGAKRGQKFAETGLSGRVSTAGKKSPFRWMTYWNPKREKSRFRWVACGNPKKETSRFRWMSCGNLGRGRSRFRPMGRMGWGNRGREMSRVATGALDRVVFDQPILDRKGTPAGTAAEVVSPPRRPLPGDI